MKKDKNLKFVNVLQDSYELWEYCKENEYTEMDYEEWWENGGELDFFEGDPDMIKVDGETGYFCKCGNVVFYYLDDLMTHEGEMILRAFFNAYETGVTLGGYSWLDGQKPKGVKDKDLQNWEAWDSISTGIAYRGGAGYTYYIQDWEKWLEKLQSKYKNVA